MLLTTQLTTIMSSSQYSTGRLEDPSYILLLHVDDPDNDFITVNDEGVHNQNVNSYRGTVHEAIRQLRSSYRKVTWDRDHQMFEFFGRNRGSLKMSYLQFQSTILTHTQGSTGN